MLASFGCDVKVVVEGSEAVQACDANVFDIALMNCQMPGVGGFEATTMIRRQEKERGQPRVPIVAVTANAMSEDREGCLSSGMDEILSKPYTMDKLRSIVDRYVCKSERRSVE